MAQKPARGAAKAGAKAATDAEIAERLAAAADAAGRDPLGGEPTRVVVLGGGASGLTAARDLARPGFTVTVLEASDRLGGTVARHEVAGLTLDSGAESFATRGGGVAVLIDELGLSAEVVTPNPAGAWLHLPDRTVPMPKGGMLGIPASPLAADVVAAIGWRGALRAYLDRLIPVMKIGQESNLGRLVRRRMGRAVLDRLVSPVATGVYSAAADDLDVNVVARGLNGALTRTGSLSGAVGELRSGAAARAEAHARTSAAREGTGSAGSTTDAGAARPAKPGSAAAGLRGGIAGLIEALAADVRARGAEVRTGERVVAVRPGPAADADAAATDDAAAAEQPAATGDGVTNDAIDDDLTAAPAAEQLPETDDAASPEHPARWLVELAGGETVPADAVLVALPGPAALDVLGTASDDAAALVRLDWPQATSVELATLVLDAPALDAAPRGTGLLVADDAHGSVTAKALTHSTAKWSWLAELAGPHCHVLRLSYGRAGRPSDTEQLTDEQLRDLALHDAGVLLDMPLQASMVVGFARTRWTNALPSAALGQRERILAVHEAVDALPGLEVTGAWISGTGLASVVPDAREAARRVRGLRWKALTSGTRIGNTGRSGLTRA